MILWLSLLLLLPQDNLVERSKQVAQALDTDKYAEVVAQFDTAMQTALPEASLKKTWVQIHKQLGNLKRTGKSRQVKSEPYEVVFVECEFERGKLELKLVFDQTNKIAGIFLLPVGSYSVPKYAKPDAVVNREASIGKGILNLPGTLMLPKSASRNRRARSRTCAWFWTAGSR